MTGNHELAIYKLPEIIQSPFFPKLLDFQILPKGRMCSMGRFILERVLPLEYYAGPVGTVIAAFFDCIEALNVLHGAGFVHGDISPGNVGFNDAVGKWQIFDFDQSRQVEDAATNQKQGGTPGFRSEKYEKTGFLTPADDFISLKLVLFWWFERQLKTDWNAFKQSLLHCLEVAIDSREPVDKLKIKVEDMSRIYNEQIDPI
jgi:serine/threonine protein kinase